MKNVEGFEGLPEDFKIPDFPKCTNYPKLQVIPSEIKSQLHAVSGLSQKITKYEDDPEICVDFNVDFTVDVEGNKTVRPYQDLKPFFNDLTNAMERYVTSDEMKQMKKLFQRKTAFFKRKAFNDMNDEVRHNNSEGRFISSTIPSSKKRKAHGTKHY